MPLTIAQKQAKRRRYNANRKARGLGVLKGRGAIERRYERNKNEREAEREEARAADELESAFSKNYDTPCEVCGETPTVGDTDLCGPHCFGEAETAGGNW